MSAAAVVIASPSLAEFLMGLSWPQRLLTWPQRHDRKFLGSLSHTMWPEQPSAAVLCLGDAAKPC